MTQKKPQFDAVPEHDQPVRIRASRKTNSKVLPLLHFGATLWLIFLLEGSHQEYIDRSKFLWWLWLVLLGILQGGPLRQGLPIHFFLIYPHMVRVAVGSQVCSSLSFQMPPYPDVIKCPELPDNSRPSVFQIVMHLFPELLFWSLGTLIVNFIFFKLYRKVPDKDVALNEERIRALTRDRFYYKKIEALAKMSKQYFTSSPCKLVLQDADVTAALAGLHRSSTKKFIANSLLYPILTMNLLLTPLLISSTCVLFCREANPDFLVQSLLSIDASDAVDVPDETSTIKMAKVLRDFTYYGSATLWFWGFVKKNSV